LILDEIVDNKLQEVARRKKECPLAFLKSDLAACASTRGFKKALSSSERVNIIAEIKRASPSAGAIIGNSGVEELAKIYEENGASALSILTDEKFFNGELKDLEKARRASSLPILAKEFIVDEYQIYEARIRGADAILLIVRILNRKKLRDYSNVAWQIGLDCVVEIHNQEEWQKIHDLPFDIVGINNRNLESFEVDLRTGLNLIKEIPSGRIVVSESGINSRDDIHRLRRAGAKAFLIGEALLRSQDVGEKLRELLGEDA